MQMSTTASGANFWLEGDDVGCEGAGMTPSHVDWKHRLLTAGGEPSTQHDLR